MKHVLLMMTVLIVGTSCNGSKQVTSIPAELVITSETVYTLEINKEADLDGFQYILASNNDSYEIKLKYIPADQIQEELEKSLMLELIGSMISLTESFSDSSISIENIDVKIANADYAIYTTGTIPRKEYSSLILYGYAKHNKGVVIAAISYKPKLLPYTEAANITGFIKFRQRTNNPFNRMPRRVMVCAECALEARAQTTPHSRHRLRVC